MIGSRSGFLVLTRIGFAARGVLYLLVAWMALRLGRAADSEAALAYLNSGAGRAVLGAMTVGFFGYGVWRLADAAFDTDGQGRDAKGITIRLAHGASGLIHLWLGWEAAELVLGSREGNEGREAAEAGAETVMSLPAGGLLLLAGAAMLVAVGAFQLVHAARRRFLRHLAPAAKHKGWVMAAGLMGYAARGFVFVIAAWLLYRAWDSSSAAAAGGLGDILDMLPGLLRTAVAVGLAAFGAFSLVEARYRIIPDPRLGDRLQHAVAR